MMDDQPVRPPCSPCCIGHPDRCIPREIVCGVCCAGLEDEEDVARNEDAVLDDVVIGLEPDDGKKHVHIRELPAPKGWSAREWLLHCISHIPYDNRCPFCNAGKRPNCHHRKSTRFRKIPFLALDYCFLKDSDTHNLLTVLVVYVKP